MLADYKNMVRVNVPSASGALFFAERISDSLNVAIKFNNDQSAASSARFVRENEILYALMPHTNIVKPITGILQHIEHGQSIDYYIMEKTDQSLEDWLYGVHAVPSKIEMFTQICTGLAHAHTNGYSHRDLHPGNVLVNNLPQDTAKLIDFGRAYDFNSTISLTSGAPVWGMLVMPPEVRFGTIENPDTATDAKGDIFALGIIFLMLFNAGTQDMAKFQKIIMDMYQYMDSNLPFTAFAPYYTNTQPDERIEKFNEWIALHGNSSTQQFSISLADVSLGDKLTEIAQKMIAFDPSNRYGAIDDIIQDLSAL